MPNKKRIENLNNFSREFGTKYSTCFMRHLLDRAFDLCDPFFFCLESRGGSTLLSNGIDNDSHFPRLWERETSCHPKETGNMHTAGENNGDNNKLSFIWLHFPFVFVVYRAR